MANLIVYRTYPWGKADRDPVLDEVEECINKEGLAKKPGIIHELSGVSSTTVYNWLKGKTRSPRYATVMAVFGALGYHSKMERSSRFDLAAERAEAKRWNMRREAAKLAKETRRKMERKRSRRSSRDNSLSL